MNKNNIEELALEYKKINRTKEYGYNTFKMRKNEELLLSKTKSILQNYGKSNKEKQEKEDELFHLLCFLSRNKREDLFDSIQPNEPGDCLINENGKMRLIEVTSCFGNDETYYHFKKRMNELFERKAKHSLELEKKEYGYTITDGIEKFKEEFKDKCSKEYVKNKKYDSVELLIVTSEYECCFPNWTEKFITKEDLKDNPFDKIMVLDYFSSGRDGNPTIIEDLEREILNKG